MSSNNKEKNDQGGFAKTTDFKWLAIGIAVFILFALMPTPDSMVQKANEIFQGESQSEIAEKALNMKIIIALLAMCTIFFAT